jgi:glyoxylase-like metal-dependent hydrolase (beta-lactamase superfamily II)
VDPQASDIDVYIRFAESKGLTITHVIDTHIQADHLSGGRSLAEKTGARYCLHQSASVAFVFTPLIDGQELDLGNVIVQILHTPGHTPESICLLGTDKTRGPDPWFLLTGDTLFVGAVGRPDLPGRAIESAAELYDSLKERILPLPDVVEVYPAHFSGSVCGAGMSGKPMSTLAFEKKWNPALQLDRETFIETLTENILPKPTEMERIMRINQGLA